MSSSNSVYDLLIVGAGALGSFHAYHATQAGLRVAVLEKDGAPQSATVRNFGQVVPLGMDGEWQLLGRRSLEIYESIQSQFDISVRRNGSIYLASDDEELTLLDDLASINERSGYRSERWSAGQCRERYPHLRADCCVGGLFFPEEVSVNPRQMIHRLHEFMRVGGTEFFYLTLVCDLTESADDTVTAAASDGRSFRAMRVLVCSGSDFQLLFPSLFAESSIELVKPQMLRLAPQIPGEMLGNILTGLSIRRYESLSECPSYQKIMAAQASDSFWKTWGVHILFKQEADGGMILGDSHEYAPAAQPDELGFDLREDINDYFIAEGKRIFD
jgi:FAD dependent oxidoreductase TIGR03364